MLAHELKRMVNDIARNAGLGDNVFAVDYNGGESFWLGVIDNRNAGMVHKRLVWICDILRKCKMPVEARQENQLIFCLYVTC